MWMRADMKWKVRGSKMVKIIIKDMMLEQKRSKGTLLIKCFAVAATLVLGLFLPFPYLFLLPLMAAGWNAPDMEAEKGQMYHLPHIQYILPVSRKSLKRYYIARAGIAALFYSVVNLFGYINCYIGMKYVYNERYIEYRNNEGYMAGAVMSGTGLLQYLLLACMISLGLFLFVFQEKIGLYARYCQVKWGTSTPIYLRMGGFTKAAAFLSWLAIGYTMTLCASHMVGIDLVPRLIKGVVAFFLIFLMLLGWILYPWVIYQCSKQLLVADYE